MARRFRAFVMFAEMRTGSNHLEATLNDFADLACLGEVYNPTFIGHHKTFEMFGIDMAARERDPVGLFDAILANTEALPGFRFFHDHDPRVLDHVLPDPTVAKIILTRNPLDSYVSRRIAAETGQWRLTDVKHRRGATRIRFDAGEFEDMLAALQDFQLKLQRGLQLTGQTAFYIRYEDINDAGVVNGLARFLGSDHEIGSTSGKLKKQNPSDLSEKVENYDEMIAAVSAMDRFDLSKTPNFEPGRHAAVPSYLALPETGLLYLPIKGARVEDVAAWMAGLDGIAEEALARRMTQKDLRRWMRTHPGHRKFTVIRHPLARAYEVFNRFILPDDRPAYADARRVLRQMYKLPIPPRGLVKGYGPAEHRAAFLAFLEFLKGNLSGQTSLKVDPAWATQTAILQGMAQVVQPDEIVREEEMAARLPALAATQGHEAAGAPALSEHAPFPLAEIRDKHIERAALNAYRRDYVNFGYGNWRPA